MRIKMEFEIIRNRDERAKLDSLIDAATYLFSSVFPRSAPPDLPHVEDFEPNGDARRGPRPA